MKYCLNNWCNIIWRTEIKR